MRITSLVENISNTDLKAKHGLPASFIIAFFFGIWHLVIEAEELCTALNEEVDSLKLRIQQLEQYIIDAGLDFSPEAL